MTPAMLLAIALDPLQSDDDRLRAYIEYEALMWLEAVRDQGGLRLSSLDPEVSARVYDLMCEQGLKCTR